MHCAVEACSCCVSNFDIRFAYGSSVSSQYASSLLHFVVVIGIRGSGAVSARRAFVRKILAVFFFVDLKFIAQRFFFMDRIE